MVINSEATKERFERTGRTMAAWARQKGLPASTVTEVVGGSYPITTNAGKRVVDALEEDGLAVWKEEKRAA